MKTDATPPSPGSSGPFTATRASRLRILLLVIFIVSLAVPFYNKTDPTLFGFPFFYWFQIAWIPFASLITYVVYRAEDKAGANQ